MRIRVGNQTSFAAFPPALPFEYAAKAGFDAFEWFPDKKPEGGWSEEDITPEMRADIRRRAIELDIRLTVHSAWPSNPLLPDFLSKFKPILRFATDIGATIMNIHLNTANGIEGYVDAIIPLLKKLSKEGIRLAIENTVETGPEDFKALFSYLRDRVPELAEHAGMCIDIGHANLYAPTRNDYLRFFDLLGPHVPIIHVHMHENHGDSDAHLPVFTGPSASDPAGVRGFIKRLIKRGYEGAIILEQWPTPEGLLMEARFRLLTLIEDLGQAPLVSPLVCHDDFVGRIIDLNARYQSWRNRLEWVRDVISDETCPIDAEELTYLAIYLKLLGTGEVPCGEDGGHYRPSHHAKAAAGIFERLSLMATTPERAFAIRKIYPWLPSFDSSFMRAEPLTRIRDIAHRNDIPGDLKREIKTTLQNKLHRSAGPEDLATSEALLKRITAPGTSYSSAFVEEFRLFYEELKEFFNARSLEAQLDAITKDLRADEREMVERFIELKNLRQTPEGGLDTLRLLTRIRRALNVRLGGEASSLAQKMQMADILLEDHAFVLLSWMINAMEHEGGGLLEGPALEALALTVENLAISGLCEDECKAVESELRAFSSGAGTRDGLLRIKAATERAARLAEAYSDLVLLQFPDKVERLGRALGVDEVAIRAFAEGDIRGHLVYQLARLCGAVLRELRSQAALPSWDAIVPGEACGVLVEAKDIGGLMKPFLSREAVVVLIDKIEGDEEMPPHIVGIIAAHQTPHLSHLAIRARQGAVAFAACEDRGLLPAIRGITGERVLLSVSSEGVTLEPRRCERTVKDIQMQMPPESLAFATSSASLIPLGEVTKETGGAKAEGARRLKELAGLEGAGFKTPGGMAVPFGVMEEAIGIDPVTEREYRGLVESLKGLEREELDAALGRISEIIMGLEVPDEITSGLKEAFGPEARLIVRSSSNCEDMEGTAGAGLYESIANVRPGGAAAAVRLVWASLYGRRAVIDREALGIPHDRARMAVLVQEMLKPDYSFVLHTESPMERDRDEIYAELAAGLGETLAAGGQQGSPYRMAIGRALKEIRMLSFSSLSLAVRPSEGGGTVHETIDHSALRLSTDEEYRRGLGLRLGAAGLSVARSFGGPQDIEGAVVDEDIFLVQSRPQQGVPE